MQARLEERERETTAQAETTREQITQLTAQLDELGRAAEEVRITRKTLLELPDPQPPAPPAPKLPDHPAYQQIMAVFTAADHPLRARQVCEAMDVAVAPNNINNVRLKLKRPAAGSWPRPSQACSPSLGRSRPTSPLPARLSHTKRRIGPQVSYRPLIPETVRLDGLLHAVLTVLPSTAVPVRCGRSGGAARSRGSGFYLLAGEFTALRLVGHGRP
ncbi:hypothetical protein ACFW93_30280 [Streptomyces canus]|uniref:hypothetical protein n=1 Tax=Streptomyces canus TaxID=58343 RepID=UPI0036CF57B5